MGDSHLKKAKDKMRQVAEEVANAAWADGARQIIKTPADIFGICLSRNIFTKDEIKVLEATYPMTEGGNTRGKGPSARAAKDVLEEMTHEGLATVTKVPFGPYTTTAYDLAPAAKKDE